MYRCPTVVAVMTAGAMRMRMAMRNNAVQI